MDRSEFVEAIRDEGRTELSRLGSSKALYALTEGKMEDDVVLARAADLADHAGDRFDDWGGDAQGSADLYARAAATAGDLKTAAAGALPEYESGQEPAVDAVLGEFDGPDERLGGLVGWTLVTNALLDQLTGYFVGQADPQTAQVFRDAGGDVETLREQALEAVADREGWPAARPAADRVVGAAYEEYFETLEGLGVNPKPVC